MVDTVQATAAFSALIDDTDTTALLATLGIVPGRETVIVSDTEPVLGDRFHGMKWERPSDNVPWYWRWNATHSKWFTPLFPISAFEGLFTGNYIWNNGNINAHLIASYAPQSTILLHSMFFNVRTTAVGDGTLGLKSPNDASTLATLDLSSVFLTLNDNDQYLWSINQLLDYSPASDLQQNIKFTISGSTTAARHVGSCILYMAAARD
ncbi:MAG: hypothetical protein AAF327_15865 [Cyanobacteria bacterium P01_A01_bin.37]